MAETKTETVILDFQVDTKQAVVSIDNLTKANKALREERKNLDTSTKEGQDRIKQINSDLDKNTQTIKDNSSALEKQRLNVGNYAGALDKLVPGLSGTVNGIIDMTKASLAFIATPIGLVIGAIGAALGSLIAYFKSSEEGQDRLNKIMLVGKTVIEQLKNFVEAFGEAIYNAFTNPEQALKNFGQFLQDQIVNRFVGMLELGGKIGKAFTLLFAGEFKEAAIVAGDAVGKVVLGVENATSVISDMVDEVSKAVQTGIKEGKQLADLQSKIDKDERKLTVERAQIALDVSKKRRDAISQEGDVKRATIAEAIALEESLSEKEVAHAQLKLQQAQLELEANGDEEDAKMKVAEATAAVINAEASRYDATLRFSKEIEKLDDAEAMRKKKIIDDQRKAENDAVNQKNKEIQDALNTEYAAEVKASEDKIKLDEDTAKKQQTVSDELHRILQGNGKATFDASKIDYSKGFDLFKKGALKQLLADTNKAAVGAMSAMSSIPLIGPILGAIAYAAIYAKGAASMALVAGINLGFKKGGYTGDGDPNQYAGPAHKSEFVMPADVVAKYGKDHFQSYMDGSVIANAATAGVGGGSQSQAPIYLGLKEFNEFKSRVELKESIVTA